MSFKKKYKFIVENSKYLATNNRAEYLSKKYNVTIKDLGIKREDCEYPDFEIKGTYDNLKNLFLNDRKEIQ